MDDATSSSTAPSSAPGSPPAAANRAALAVEGARFVDTSVSFLREEKSFASTEGTFTHQTLFRSAPRMTVTAVAPDGSDFQTRASTDIAPAGRGYEYVLEADMETHAARWAEDAVRKLRAKPVEPGTYDLVLLPTHLWLTIHESIAHPTELLYTGLTRDGTFLIENGRIAGPVQNLRWNESPIAMLNNVELIGQAEPVLPSEGGAVGQAVVVPPLKVRNFHFTSVSDAV